MSASDEELHAKLELASKKFEELKWQIPEKNTFKDDHI